MLQLDRILWESQRCVINLIQRGYSSSDLNRARSISIITPRDQLLVDKMKKNNGQNMQVFSTHYGIEFPNVKKMIERYIHIYMKHMQRY